MQQTGHLHKILPTLSRKTTVYVLQYSPPAAWSIRKFKGLPLLLDQAVLSLPLSQTWPWWHRFLNKRSEVDRCSLSVFLEQKSQPRQSSSKTSQLPSVQLGQYSCSTSLLQASHEEHKMTQMNIAGRRGTRLSKVISLLKADVRTKCYFLLCIKRLVLVMWGRKMCANPVQCTHAEYLGYTHVMLHPLRPEACLHEAKSL